MNESKSNLSMTEPSVTALEMKVLNLESKVELLLRENEEIRQCLRQLFQAQSRDKYMKRGNI